MNNIKIILCRIIGPTSGTCELLFGNYDRSHIICDITTSITTVLCDYCVIYI